MFEWLLSNGTNNNRDFAATVSFGIANVKRFICFQQFRVCFANNDQENKVNFNLEKKDSCFNTGFVK